MCDRHRWQAIQTLDEGTLHHETSDLRTIVEGKQRRASMCIQKAKIATKIPYVLGLYITQKIEFTAGLHMLIDQIDSVLQKDNECQKAMGFQTVKTPRFYLTGT